MHGFTLCLIKRCRVLICSNRAEGHLTCIHAMPARVTNARIWCFKNIRKLRRLRGFQRILVYVLICHRAEKVMQTSMEDDIREDGMNAFDFDPKMPYRPQWARPVRWITLFFLIIASIWAFTLLSSVFTIVVISLLLAFILYKPSRFFFRRVQMPWALSVTLTYFLVITIIFFTLVALIPRLTSEASNLAGNIATIFEDLQQRAHEYDPEEDGVIEVFGFEVDANIAIQPIVDVLKFLSQAEVPEAESTTDETTTTEEQNVTPTEDPQSLTRVRIDPQSLANSFVGDVLNLVGTITTWLTSTIGGVVGFLFTLLFALFISFLILIDLQNTRRSFVHRIPDAYHREVAIIIRKIITVWNGFLRGQVTLALLIGVVTYLQLLVMGAPGALTLASFTAVISLIPTIGGFIALVPLFVLPLLTGSTVMTQTSPLGFALLVILINMLITQFIWNVIAPIILGDVLNLPTPVIILGVFVGGAVGGILGAFLVAPAVSTVIIVVDYLIAKISARDPFPGEEGRIASEWEVKAIRRQKNKEKSASASQPAEAN